MTWNLAIIDNPKFDTGYHINLPNYLLTEELGQFQVFPETPNVVFAGQETVFLSFENEAQAIAALPQYWIEEYVTDEELVELSE